LIEFPSIPRVEVLAALTGVGAPGAPAACADGAVELPAEPVDGVEEDDVANQIAIPAITATITTIVRI
jgi:hypothetical protein